MVKKRTQVSVKLLGIPDDQGVKNVGGRVGAAQAPEKIRACLNRFSNGLPIQDLGDVTGLNSDVRQNLERAAQFVSGHLNTGRTVVLGGGHDHAYSVFKAYRVAFPSKRVGCINLDAHFDLRATQPIMTSGSGFRLAIEEGLLLPKYFVEFGIQPHCNREELFEYARGKKIRTVPLASIKPQTAVKRFAQELEILARKVDRVFVSLDLDVVAEAFAPGVSAPVSEGLTASEVLSIAAVAGRNPKVQVLGVFELSPPYDQGDRTARLAATAVDRFTRGAII